MQNDNTVAQLNSNISTPVGANFDTSILPNDISNTALEDIATPYRQAASNFAALGGELAQDVQSRQRLLIGNNYGPADGSGQSGMGGYNYQRNYAGPVAAGANALVKLGTSKALNEGMRRAQLDAEEKNKAAQKRYNKAVQVAQAKAAAAAAAQERKRQLAQEQARKGAQMSTTGSGLSASDITAVTDPNKASEKVADAYEAKAGIKWDPQSKLWGESRNATTAWAKSRGLTHAVVNGRDQWVDSKGNVNKDAGVYFTKYYMSKQNPDPKLYEKRETVRQYTKDNIKVLLDDPKKFFSGLDVKVTSSNYITTSYNKSIIDQLAKQIEAKAKPGQINQSKAMTQEVSIAYTKAISSGATDSDRAKFVELANQSGLLKEFGINYSSKVPEQYSALKDYKKDDATALKTAQAAGLSVSANIKKEMETFANGEQFDLQAIYNDELGVTTDDIKRMQELRAKDEARWERNVDIATNIASGSYMKFSDGTDQLEDGTVVERGKMIVYTPADVSLDPNWQRFDEIIKNLPTIEVDGKVTLDFGSSAEINSVFGNMMQTASVAEMLSNQLDIPMSKELVASASRIATNSGLNVVEYKDKDGNMQQIKLNDGDLKSKINKIQFDGKQLSDIITGFNGLDGKQQAEVLVALAKQGNIYSGEMAGNTHGLFDASKLSKEEAQALYVQVMYQSTDDITNNTNFSVRPEVTTLLEGAVDVGKGALETIVGGAASAVDGVTGLAGMLSSGVAGSIAGTVAALGGDDFGTAFGSTYDKGFHGTQLSKDFHDLVWNVEDLKDLSTFAKSTGLEQLQNVGEPSMVQQGIQFISGMGKEVTGFIVFGGVAKAVGNLAKADLLIAKNSPAYKYAEATANLVAKPYAETITKMVVDKTTNMLVKADMALARSGLNVGRSTAQKAVVAGDDILQGYAAKSATAATENATAFASSVFAKAAAGKTLTNAEKLYNLTATNFVLRSSGMAVGAFYKASNGARAVASTLIRGGAPEAGAWIVNASAKAIANGERFGLSKAIKVIPTAIKEAGLATGSKGAAKFGRLMEIAAMESKYTMGFMTFDLAKMNDKEVKDMFGHEEGMLDYVAENFLTDAMFNAFGYGLAGPALRAGRTKYYRGKLNKWEERKLESAQESEARAKAEAKLTHYTEKANNYANRVVAESLIGENTPALQQLIKQTDDVAETVFEETMNDLGIKPGSVEFDEFSKGVTNKVDFNTAFARNRAAIKAVSRASLTNLKDNLMPKMYAKFEVSPLAGVQFLKDVETLRLEMGKATPKEVDNAIVERLSKKWELPKSEVKTWRDRYNQALTVDIKERKGYFSITPFTTKFDRRNNLYEIGITANPLFRFENPKKGREKTDVLALLTNIETKLMKSTKRSDRISAKEEGFKGDGIVQSEEFDTRLFNPVMGLHIYENLAISDKTFGQFKRSVYDRLDAIKVVDDATYDELYKKMFPESNRFAARSKEGRELVKKLVDKMAPEIKASGDKKVDDFIAKRRKEVENMAESMIRGFLGPEQIRRIASVLDGGDKALDNFMVKLTGVNAASNIRVYKGLRREQVLNVYKAQGRDLTREEVKELDKAIDGYWTGGKAKQAKDDNEFAKTLNDLSVSPAEMFRRTERALDRFNLVASNYSDVMEDFLNTRLLSNAWRTAKEGDRIPLKDLITNESRVNQILKQLPGAEAVAEVQSVLDNAVVVFEAMKDKAGRVVVEDGNAVTVYINPKTKHIDATLAHEYLHVLDKVEASKYNKALAREWKIGEDLPYMRKPLEQRAFAFEELYKASHGYNHEEAVLEQALKFADDGIAMLSGIADRMNIKGYRPPQLEESAIPGAIKGDGGVTYVRRSEFEANPTSRPYVKLDDMEMPHGQTAGLSKEVKASVEKSMYMAEGTVVEGDIYLDQDYAKSLRGFVDNGGSADLGSEGMLERLARTSNNIQQWQLAAGVSYINAYTTRQFMSAFSAVLFNNPIDAFRLFESYHAARTPETMKKYLAKNGGNNLLTLLATKTGDTSIIDSIADIFALTKEGSSGAIDDIARRLKENAASYRASGGKKKSLVAKSTMDMLDRIVDEPTFKRYIPILMTQMLETSFRRNLKKRGIRLGRDVNPANFPGDQKVLDEVLDATWSEHLMFWDAQVGLEAKHGGITKRNIDTSAKFLHGKNTGKTFNNLASGIFFAMKYRLTMMTRLINGVIGLAPKNLGKSEFNQSRSLLASVVGTIVAAQTYNYIANGHTDLVDAIDSASAGDPNDLMYILNNFGILGRFNIGGDNGVALDPLFSMFTATNTVFRTGSAAFNAIMPPRERIIGVSDLGHEVFSLTLSPINTIYDLVSNKTYYGYSIWGRDAGAIDDEGNVIPYDPMKNALAITSHLLGLDRYLDGKGAGFMRNERGEIVSGPGLLQHEYIDAISAFDKGDYYGFLMSALELPIKKTNVSGRAIVTLNNNVVNTLRSYKAEYDDKLASGNLSHEDKDKAYKVFAEKSLETLMNWNRDYRVLENRPELLQAANKVIVGILADEFSDEENKVKNAYWAAGIDALGGFDKKSHETDEEYEARREKVTAAYNEQQSKERAAREVLASLGYTIEGREYTDMRSKYYDDKKALLAQFQAVMTGKVGDNPDMGALKKDYTSRLADARARKDKATIAALEAEYINMLDEKLAPYIDKYGVSLLDQNYDFAKEAASYVLIPSSDYFKYTGENANLKWLKDHYGIGYKNSSALIADSDYMGAYEKFVNSTIRGNAAEARARAEAILKNIANGRYTVSDKQYNEIVRLTSKLRNR